MNPVTTSAPSRPSCPSPDRPSPAETAPTRLLLIRHGEVESRYQGIFGGRIDMELSPRGHEQADALAAYLRRQPLSAIYASPMKRVQQTLAPLLVNGTPRPVILPDLREADFGDWTGLAWADVEAKFGVSAFAWLEQLDCDGIANAECADTLRDRVEPCLRQILDTHPGQEVAVFCHGGIIRVLLSIMLRWPLARMAAFEIEYASVTRVLALPEGAELQLVNFTPWRETA
ncbi:MAG TPA: histidine phosphatase family protein [Verrucomicrobiota bacterium]|nr:histidine phosphatase family protein [Verrucomicrobiota bacterium]